MRSFAASCRPNPAPQTLTEARALNSLVRADEKGQPATAATALEQSACTQPQRVMSFADGLLRQLFGFCCVCILRQAPLLQHYRSFHYQ